MQQIYPTPETLDDIDALSDAYAYPDLADGAAWVRANMVTSLDGAAQGPNGRSATVSSPPDRRVLSLLRGLADVVLVGATTARVERYRPAEPHRGLAQTRRSRGQPPAATMAVVSRSLDLDPGAALFTAAPLPTIVLTVDAAPAERLTALRRVADVAVVGHTTVDIDAAVAALIERGHARVLCEGGPHLLAHIVEAARLDELCLTLTPKIVGGHATRMLETPRPLTGDWRIGHLIEEGGTLLTRWLAPAS